MCVRHTLIFFCIKRPYDQNIMVIYKWKDSKLIMSKDIDPMVHGHILRMLMDCDYYCDLSKKDEANKCQSEN